MFAVGRLLFFALAVLLQKISQSDDFTSLKITNKYLGRAEAFFLKVLVDPTICTQATKLKFRLEGRVSSKSRIIFEVNFVVNIREMNVTFYYSFNDQRSLRYREKTTFTTTPATSVITLVGRIGPSSRNFKAICNGRDYFPITNEWEYVEDVSFTTFIVYAGLSGCTGKKNRIKSVFRTAERFFLPSKQMNFNASVVVNMRLLGQLGDENKIICSMRFDASSDIAIEFGAYSFVKFPEKQFAYSIDRFMGYILNPAQEHGTYIKAFGNIAEDTKTKMDNNANPSYKNVHLTIQKAYQLKDGLYSQAVQFCLYTSSFYKITELCRNVHQCEIMRHSFLATGLVIGTSSYAFNKELPNNAYSRCTMTGPNIYRDIIDRSDKLPITYAYTEDRELMRQRNEGNSRPSIDGVQLVPTTPRRSFMT